MRELMRINAQRWRLPSVVMVSVNPVGDLHSSLAGYSRHYIYLFKQQRHVERSVEVWSYFMYINSLLLFSKLLPVFIT